MNHDEQRYMSALEARLNRLEAALGHAHMQTADHRQLARKLKLWQAAALALLLAVSMFAGLQSSIASTGKENSLYARVGFLEAEIARLKTLVEDQAEALDGRIAAVAGSVEDAFESIAGVAGELEEADEVLDLFSFEPFSGDLVLTGTNLHIRNGDGATDTVNGKGNLIVGYNENPLNYPLVSRGGSHNVIVGSSHAWFSHSGIVTGEENGIRGINSAAIGGSANNVIGFNSVIIGGRLNQAEQYNSTIVGAVSGLTHGDGDRGVIIGGRDNEVTDYQTVAIGGAFNKVTKEYGIVLGGRENIASGWHGNVTGGHGNIASGDYSVVGGGVSNVASGLYSVVSGGEGNISSGERSVVSGGVDKTASGDGSHAP